MKQIVIAGNQNNLLKIFSVTLLIFLFSACSKEKVTDRTDENLAILLPVDWNTGTAAMRTDITTGSFSAIAAIQYCWGENVRFFGTIENKVNLTTDANGTEHYSRHWTIKGLNAVGVTSGAGYTVIAGAEMFSVMDPVFNSGGVPVPATSGKVFMHEGTVVLQNNVTGERVVARHVIKKDPRTGEVTSGWYCMGK